MIGNFKPKPRESWKSQCIVTKPDEAYNEFLRHKGAFIDCREIDDKCYYQVYRTSMTTKEETEAVIYQQILELEAIELHKMKTIIESKKGICLDLKTDCISCIFPNNTFPFELYNDSTNIKGYYFDKSCKVPRYKLEDSDSRLKDSKLKGYKRVEQYKMNLLMWNVIKDVSDNDFTPE